jgi:hypothetical protein
MPNFRPKGIPRAKGRDSRGIAKVRKFASAFAAISLLAAAVYAQSLAKASNRSGGDQQIDHDQAAAAVRGSD